MCKLFKTALIGFLLVSLHNNNLALADSLDDILHSDSFKKVEQNNRKFRSKKDKKVADTNYARLFAKTKKEKKNLPVSWLGKPSAEFSLSRSDYILNQRIFTSTAIYINNNSLEEFHLTIMIPHPDQSSGVEYGLLKEFNEVQPTDLAIESDQKIEFDDLKANLYKLKNSNYHQLNVKLPKNTLLYIRSKGTTEQITNLAKSLDLKRLAIKLES